MLRAEGTEVVWGRVSRILTGMFRSIKNAPVWLGEVLSDRIVAMQSRVLREERVRSGGVQPNDADVGSGRNPQNVAVNVVVVVRSLASLQACLESIRSSSYPAELLSVSLVAASSGVAKKLQSGFDPSLHVSADDRRFRGLCVGVNNALKQSDGKFVLLMTSDVRLRPAAVNALVHHASVSGDAGFRAWEPRRSPGRDDKFYDPVTRDLTRISIDCCLLDRESLQEIGGLNADGSHSLVAADLSWRLRKHGGRLQYVSEAVVDQAESARTGIHPHDELVAGGVLRSMYGGLDQMVIWGLLVVRHFVLPPQHVSGSRLRLWARLIAAIPCLARAVIGRNACFAGKESESVLLDWSGFGSVRKATPNHFPPVPSQPLVSIVVRTMNRPEYLQEALTSVRHQTYRNVEVVVVEDGCDAGRQVARAFSDLRLRYIPTGAHVGRERAGNIGLEHASGKYVNFLDDDDLLFDNHVETLVAALEANHSFGAAHCAALEVEWKHIQASPLTGVQGNSRTVFARPFERDEMRTANRMVINSVMFSRRLFEVAGGFDETLDLLEDWNLWCRYAQWTDYLYVDKTTCLFRVPLDSEAQAERREAHRKAYDAVRQMNAKLLDVRRGSIFNVQSREVA